MPPLPTFLIIGAMRAGTTALYADLDAHPQLFGAPGKEPHLLVNDQLDLEGCRRAYGELFSGARPDQRCFEASTGYAKRPLFEGVAARARAVLGPGVKAIYLVRDPIRRAISHHHYHINDPRIDRDFDKAVATWPELTDFGRYAMQLEPWLETFGTERVLVVRFEDYIARRGDTLGRIYRFLGLDVPTGEGPDALAVAPGRRNASTEAYSPTGLWRWVSRRETFRRHLRHRLPEPVVEMVRRRWFRPPPRKPAPPSAATLDRLIAVFAPEILRLGAMLGASEPMWDLHATRAELLGLAQDTDQTMAGAARV